LGSGNAEVRRYELSCIAIIEISPPNTPRTNPHTTAEQPANSQNATAEGLQKSAGLEALDPENPGVKLQQIAD
jgi:hypothetical protein